jgi:hypothetical protein
MFNYLVYGTPFSKRRMMYNIAKMKVGKRGGFKGKDKPKEFYEYKVYVKERRKEMALKVWNYAIEKHNERKNKKLQALKTLNVTPNKLRDLLDVKLAKSLE